MSVQAMGQVMASSPNTGAVYLCELMIADSVNDQHDWVFWMSNSNLALKARVARQTANNAMSTLEAQGVISKLGYTEYGTVKWRWLGGVIYAQGGVTRGDTCHERRQGVSPQATKGVITGDTNQSEPNITQGEKKTLSRSASVKAIKAIKKERAE
tara:strand:+ start:560 stop:1024 length:465 start_codon:yes stop_codon:yes gene_type:complete